MFSYSGWNAAAYVAEEVRNPSRNVPLALGLGTVAVIVLYVGLNALYLYALPIDQLAALPGGTAARHGRGPAVWDRRPAISSASSPSSASPPASARWCSPGPRVYFAMARDGMFVRAAARVHPRFHTPATAIVAQGVWSSVLVLSGTQAQLVNYTGFAVVLFAGVTVSALFVLRRRDPGAPRPFSALGYPWAPGDLRRRERAHGRSPKRSGRDGPTVVGVALIGLGVPVYLRDPASAASVSSARMPSLAAKRRNDAGECRTK